MATPFDNQNTAVVDQASAAAVSYLRDLMIEKAISRGVDLHGQPIDAEAARVAVDSWIARNSDKATISENIDRLKAEGYTGRSFGHLGGKPETIDVPEGRYAVATEDGAANELAFYKVDRPTEGRWAGYVFVKRQVGGHDDTAVKGKAAQTVLAKIAEDVKGASLTYGREIGRCGVCGTTLTNDESRARGIGPVCATKAGW